MGRNHSLINDAQSGIKQDGQDRQDKNGNHKGFIFSSHPVYPVHPVKSKCLDEDSMRRRVTLILRG
jgi:hypothetical protein